MIAGCYADSIVVCCFYFKLLVLGDDINEILHSCILEHKTNNQFHKTKAKLSLETFSHLYVSMHKITLQL